MLFRKNRRKSDVQRHGRRKRYLGLLIASIIGGTFLIILVSGEVGLLKLMEVFRTHRHLSQEIQYLKERNEALRHKAQALRTDPDTIEAIARQELGLVKKGELIYQFQPESEK